MLTRDSMVWWLALAAAVVGYLITAEKPPTAWSYAQWLQAAAFVLAWLAGRLSNSPLAGEHDHPADTKTVLGVFSVKE